MVATTVESKLRSLELADYAALRAFTGTEKHIQIVSPGIAGLFYYDAADTISVDNGGTIIVASNGKRWKRIYEGGVNIKWFGATVNGTDADDDAMDKALAAIGNSGSIELQGRPVFRRPVAFPIAGKGIRVFAKSQITVMCDHTGHGFVLDTINYTYGGHILENLTIQGPNVAYPTVGYTPTSAGYGIKCQVSFDNTFKNVRVYGFLRGLSLKVGFNNKTEGDCQFMFNQYGIVLEPDPATGGATNVNRLLSVKVRENRIAGILIDGSAGAPYPTGNCFSGYVETNIPYSSGYPVGGPGDGTAGVGVVVKYAFDNCFSEVYFENQEYDIWLERSSGNIFSRTRHAPSADYSRLGKIKFKGPNIFNTVFVNSCQVSRNVTDVHIESDDVNQSGIQFLDTVGFNFINSSILGKLDIRNNKPFSLIHGNQKGQIGHFNHGVITLLGEGTTRGRISGIGTETAVAYVDGLGELGLSNSITAPTTIVSFVGLVPGQFFTISNYQINHAVTIKSSTDDINGIMLKDRKNAVLLNYSDSVTFYVINQGKVVEVGRSTRGAARRGNWTPTLNASGGASISLASASGTWVLNQESATLWFSIVGATNLAETNYYDIGNIPVIPAISQQMVGVASSASSSTNSMQRSTYAISLSKETSTLRVYVSPVADFQNTDTIYGSVTYLI